MVGTSPEQILDLFFPGIGGHLRETDSPYQFSYQLCFSGKADIETIHMRLISICMWARENFENRSWYINKNKFINVFEPDVCFCFDFANAEDMMAFKLRWS